MNDQHPDPMQQITGQVRSLFYLIDEPATTLTIQIDGQMITVRATGQVALELRALSRGATIYATLHATPPHDPQIIAFTISPPDRAFQSAKISNSCLHSLHAPPKGCAVLTARPFP